MTGDMASSPAPRSSSRLAAAASAAAAIAAAAAAAGSRRAGLAHERGSRRRRPAGRVSVPVMTLVTTSVPGSRSPSSSSVSCPSLMPSRRRTGCSWLSTYSQTRPDGLRRAAADRTARRMVVAAGLAAAARLALRRRGCLAAGAAVPRPAGCGRCRAIDRRAPRIALQHLLALLGRHVLHPLAPAASAGSARRRRPRPRCRALCAGAPGAAAPCGRRARGTLRASGRRRAVECRPAQPPGAGRGPCGARCIRGRGPRPAVAALRSAPGGVWPSAANISLVGRKRSAAFGTRSTLVRARDLDVDVRRHARLQLQLGVRHVDDRRVGDDVLLDDRLQPHLRHRADEVVGRVGVDAEGDVLARTDAADVRLVEVGDDLHLRQVGGEDEQRRRLHAGGDRLADVHVARDDQAVDRRGDDRVLEVDLVLVERGLRLRDLTPPTSGSARRPSGR